MGRGEGGTQPATRRRYDPDRALAACKVLDSSPIGLADFEYGLGDDGDLRDNLDARYGTALSNYRFELVEIPIEQLRGFVPREGTLQYLRDMLESDEEWEHQVQTSGEEPDWVFEDAAERLAITENYVELFRKGQKIKPLVVDFHNLSDGIDLLDGYHRLGAAAEAGAESLRAYRLLEEED